MKGFEVQEAGDRWLQQRAEYRAARQKWVREHEQLPEHDGEKYVIAGEMGSERVGLAVGKIKGPGAGKAIIDGLADAARAAGSGFSILDDNPSMLASELRDLERDARAMAIHEGVRYFEVETGATMDLPPEATDEEIDQWMQMELQKRLEKR